MKKSIFLFFAAILCSVSAWAYDASSAEIYYDNTKSQWSDVQLFIGKSDWNSINPMTKITNTNNLYCLYNFSWGGYSAFYFTTGVAGWDPLANNENVDNRSNWATCRSAKQTTSLGSSVNLYISTGTSKGASVTRNTITDYKDLNYKQTVQQQLTSDGTSYSASTEAIATVKVSSYKLGSATATSATANNGSITSGSSSAECEAARTATVTYSVTGVNSAYTFVGWYDGDTQKSTSSTYTYQATEAKTITARFAVATEEEHEVTITYVCGSNTVSAATSAYVGVETEKTFTAPTVTGYNFTGWTKGAGIIEKSSNENTITILTKTGETDYTLVANYEEVMETVYFINSGNWADVHIHLWNGTATGTEWPGTQLTATGTKIGEYDVYEYTAQQGAHVNLLFHKKNNDSQKTADLTWTAGKYYIHNHNGKTGWYTQAEAEEILVVPVVEETVYFVNNKNWTKVQVHAWKDAVNNGWPGQALTATGEKVAGFDVYSFTAPQGTYTNLLFNNKEGDAGVQSNNFVWTADKYYYMGAAENYAGGTKEEVAVLVAPDPLATEVYLAGDMTNKDNWDVNKKEFRKATNDATTASVTVTLAAQTYKFKLVVGGAWKGNTGTMTRGGESVHEGGWQFDADGYDDNCQIVADIAGDYTFTWNLTDKKLTVAYPPLPKHQVTATVNPAESGTVTGTGEYEQGSEATLIATPAAGYTFKNWTVAGTEKSVEATYKFAVTEAVELVANFVTEETHEVTISYLCNGTPIPGQAETKLAVGITTPSTISAPAITNYKFDSWKVGSGVQAVDATKDPIQITTLATGDYTLAANYTKIELKYNVTVPAGTPACYIAGEMNSWTLTEMTKVDDTHYTITIDGATTEHKYKYACGDSWDYVELKADGSEVADRSYSENDVVEKWSTLAKCYLMGNGDWVNGVEMEYDSENGQYILLCHHISAPFKFKLGDEWSDQVENNTENGVTWTDEDADGNFDINLPEGDYNFYFKKDSKKAYIEVSTPTLNRTVPVGYYATVCLSQNIIKVVGATLFEVAGKDGNKVIFDEVLTPVAGMPYIFLAEENTISFYCGIETAATPGNHKSLHGTFEDMADAELDGMYMVQNNKIVKCAATGCNIPANRAYFNGTELEALGVPPTPMPGRRRITMGAEGENTTTGVEGIVVPEGQTIKVISNGQLIIIRNGEKFNAQGVRL